MKTSCLVSLLLYAALVFGYHRWLAATLDPPEVWIAACVVALIVLGSLGAIYNSFLLWRDGSVLSDALHDMPRRDGKRTAAAGTIEPLSQPLVAPLSGQSAVLYEYDIARYVTRTKKGGGTETSKSVDFAGLGKCECVVRGAASSLRLIGFPDLDHVQETEFGSADDEARAKQYVQFTAWEDASGLGVFHGARDMWSALTGSDEALRKDWRMIAIQECPWLAPGAVTPQVAAAAASPVEPQPIRSGETAADEVQHEVYDDEELEQDLPDEEFDGDDFDDDDWDGPPADGGYHPSLSEKRVAPGQQVVAIGHYDEVRQGLVAAGGQTIRFYADDLHAVASKLAASKWRHLIGGIIGLIVANLALLGVLFIYRHSDATHSHWKDELREGIGRGDLAAVEKVLNRGAEVDAPLDSEGTTGLMEAKDAAMAKLLLDRGANVNAADGDGVTALMRAVRNNRADIAAVLIGAGADVDRKNTIYGTTALMEAIDSERGEIVELLRKAGAKDDTVTAASGQPIDESHGAFAVCREYLTAVFAADPQKLRELSTRENGADYDDVDFAIWQESRPKEPRLVEGFVREGEATVIVTGPAPIGADRTWRYQLRREAGQWRVARERWLVNGLP